MFGARINCLRHSKRLFFNFHYRRSFCNSTTHNNKQQHPQSSSSSSIINGENNGSKVSDIRNLEGYRDLDNLDFMKAAKILFSTPPKKKKFGIDFHLVQLFFALMPSLGIAVFFFAFYCIKQKISTAGLNQDIVILSVSAVYLVAQYARYEIRRMEAEVEVKKKAEEEQKAKEMEAGSAEEKEAEPVDPELLKVKERLEALEETMKEIVVETKKRPNKEKSQSVDQRQERVDPSSRSVDSHTTAKEQPATEELTSGQPHKQHVSEKKGSQGHEKK